MAIEFNNHFAAIAKQNKTKLNQVSIFQIIFWNQLKKL